MIDRERKGDFAVLVYPEVGRERGDEQLQEFTDLVESAGIEIATVIRAPRDKPEPSTFVGSGKVEEIADALAMTGADLVLFDTSLAAIQERNLERQLKCRVHDRTTLILDIFAQRARSHEGKLQVELAQLRHLSTRLVRGWTHLERQKGGIGLRGPGETQLETDRRLLAARVKSLKARLKKVETQRSQSRRSRKRNEVPVVALVGYTNAGKSTLFNALTEGKVYAADQLFATLDPTLKGLELPSSTKVVLADTVGFVRDLPHELIAAFRATLQETKEADLLLHVVDAADPRRSDTIAEVNAVLDEIGTEVPQLMVYNKIDRMDVEPHVDYDDNDDPIRVWVSALADQGLLALLDCIDRQVQSERTRGTISLPMDAGALRAKLYELGAIRSEAVTDDGSWELEIELENTELARLCSNPQSAKFLDRLAPEPAPT